MIVPFLLNPHKASLTCSRIFMTWLISFIPLQLLQYCITVVLKDRLCFKAGITVQNWKKKEKKIFSEDK